jgi:uncharacterized protein (TIGR02246 family)
MEAQMNRPVADGRVKCASAILACLTLSAACAPASDFDPDDPAVVAAIDSIVQVALEGSRAADADRVLAMAEGGSDFTFITGDLLLSGLEDIREDFADTYEGVESQSQTILEKRTRLLTPDVAVLTAVSEGTYTDIAGWTSEPVGMGHTIVFVRENGQWRARHAHQSIAP